MRLKYGDYFLAIGSCLLLMLVTLLYVHFHHVPNYFQPYTPTPQPQTSTQPLPVPYPSPNKKQLDFDTVFQTNGVSVEVQRGDTNIVNNNVSSMTFHIIYVNLTNEPITLASDSTSIGCIVAHNQSYKNTSGIFTTSERVTVPPFYSPVELQIQVRGDCLYLGTGDGEYYWELF